jgi:hypothetical protein
MQRSTGPSPTSPKSSSLVEHSAKRQRLSNGSRVSLSDYERGQAALAEEELKRSKAIDRQAAELGETKWVLSIQEPKVERSSLKIVSASFADIDASDDESDDAGEETTSRASGRISYGKVWARSLRTVLTLTLIFLIASRSSSPEGRRRRIGWHRG